MTYLEALEYLDSYINFEKTDSYDYRGSFKLERMARLAGLLGDPHKKVRSIHVAGTKGKGSTCAIIHSILKSAGFRVGLYTSPHLVSFRERIRINDTLISEEDIGALMERVKSAADAMGDMRPTFFELYTALAYLYFSRNDPDFVIYEVGLGGRLDATNLIDPLVCVITPISYEHTHILGDTLAKIAAEKAGIIKKGSVCVSAPQEKEVVAVIEETCSREDASLILAGRDIFFEEIRASDEAEVFTVKGMFGEYRDMHMGLIGSHQVVNAAVAVGAAEAMRLSGVAVNAEDIKKGIRAVKWPGRLELIKGSPRILLDGAQNHASARALALAVRRLFKYRKLIMILGVSKDKDIKGILKELIPVSDTVVLTKSRIAARALAPSRIKELITPAYKDVVVAENVDEALAKAVSLAAPQDLVLITGSLFVVGEARKILMKDEERDQSQTR